MNRRLPQLFCFIALFVVVVFFAPRPWAVAQTYEQRDALSLPPVIDSLWPESGGPGTVVVITGANLTDASRVEFNGNFAYEFSVVSDTELTAVVPTHLTTGRVTVATPGGLATSAVDFTATVSYDPSYCDPCHLPLSGQTIALSDDGGSVTVDGIIYDLESNEQEATPLTFIHDFSDDNRYVVGDIITEGRWVSYVYDRQTRTTTPNAVAPNGAPGNGMSSYGSISGDGRYVAFSSGSSNLVPLDSNGKYDVFVRDRETGTTTRVSVTTGGLQSNGHSDTVAISSDGRYVAFHSEASNLVPDDDNGTPDVFIHDRVAHTTRRVPLPALGSTYAVDYDDLSFSADLRYIAFSSMSDALTPGDTNGIKDAYLFDRHTGETTLISVTANGSSANGQSNYTVISADGRFIAFTSVASNLVAADTNEKADVFIFDRLTSTIKLISVASDGSQGQEHSVEPTISADGRHITFISWGNNLDPDSPHQDGNVYLFANRIERAIAGFTPVAAIVGDRVVINGTGLGEATAVEFNGTAATFTPLSDRQLQAVVPSGVSDGPISVTFSGGDRVISSESFLLIRPAAITSFTPESGPSRSTVLISGANLTYASTVTFNGVAAAGFDVLSDTQLSAVVPTQATSGRIGVTTPAGTAYSGVDFTVEPCLNPCRILAGFDGRSVNGASRRPIISPDGRFVAFSSLANNLVPGDVNDQEDAFVHDLLTGVTTLVSVNSEETQFNVIANAGPISADGRYVVFFTYSQSDWETYIRDQQTGTTIDLQDLLGTQSELYAVSLSGDGRYISFASVASTLIPGDTNGAVDVFVHDLETGQTKRVSVASDGTEGNAPTIRSSISADGRFVTFNSYASNLVPGDTNDVVDTFVHDRHNGTTSRVSLTTDGAETPFGSADQDIPYLSHDGRYVIFGSYANTLAPGDNNEEEDIYLHDRQTGETTLISQKHDGTAHRIGASYRPSISGDGRFVAFYSQDRLVPDDTDDNLDIYLYDRQIGSMRRFLTNVNDEYISMSADGRFFAFSAVFADSSPTGPSIHATGPSATLMPIDATAFSVTSDDNEVEDIYVYRRDARGIISGFTPTYGLAGTPVTILGRDMFDVTAVTFNGVSALFTVNSSARISTIVPQGATTGPILVSMAGGAATSNFSFAVMAPPPPATYLSPTTTGTLGDISFTYADILAYDHTTNTWDIFYDGSTINTTKNLGAFAFRGGDVILGFSVAQLVPGLGAEKVMPQDLVRFMPSRTGYNNTAGQFARFFDGSDVGLTTAGESIDALWIDHEGRFYISTAGSGVVPANSIYPSGAKVKFQDEDVLRFTPTTIGATTAGLWELYWDPTRITKMSVEDINGYWEDPATGHRYVTILGAFTVGNAAYGGIFSGDGKTILRFVPNAAAPGGYAPAEKLTWLASGSTLPPKFAIDGIEMAR